MRRIGIGCALWVGMCASASSAAAETYSMGPTRAYRQFADLPTLRPGDVVEVDGGADYEAVWFQDDGAAGMPITIRGIRDASGARPRIVGGRNTVELMGDHYVFEGFDVSGGEARCVFHHADDIVVRDCVIHDCPQQGVLGADTDSGSLLLEYTEIHHCGEGTFDHQVYMSTDQEAHPGSVFRMQFCWIHDGNGGNNVKSRAERNEIYYNWLEGSYYHQLELIGPDPGGTSIPEDANREDSDVVGNVLIMNGVHPSHYVVRFGGDGTGQSNGVYRFVNNTVILAADSAGIFRLFDGIESLEASNNVFFQIGSGDAQVVRDAEAAWVGGRDVSGTNNWLVTGTGLRDIPDASEWMGSITGTDPGFEDLAGDDLRPAMTSPLVNAGATAALVPTSHPPAGMLIAPGTGMPRPSVMAIDIGAYEHGSGPPVMPTDAGPPMPGVDSGPPIPGVDSGPPLPGVDSGPATPPRDAGGSAGAGDEGGCGCQTTRPSDAPTATLALLAPLALLLRRRHVT